MFLFILYKVKLILERERVGLNFIFAVGIVIIIQMGWQTTLILRDLKGWV